MMIICFLYTTFFLTLIVFLIFKMLIPSVPTSLLFFPSPFINDVDYDIIILSFEQQQKTTCQLQQPITLFYCFVFTLIL